MRGGFLIFVYSYRLEFPRRENHSRIELHYLYDFIYLNFATLVNILILMVNKIRLYNKHLIKQMPRNKSVFDAQTKS